MQVTKKLYLCAVPVDRYNTETWQMEHVVDFTAWEHNDYSGHPAVAELEVVFEAPDNLDYTELKISKLQKERTELMAEFNKRVTEIQAEINQLTAIESSVPQGEDLDIPF